MRCAKQTQLQLRLGGHMGECIEPAVLLQLPGSITISNATAHGLGAGSGSAQPLGVKPTALCASVSASSSACGKLFNKQ